MFKCCCFLYKTNSRLRWWQVEFCTWLSTQPSRKSRLSTLLLPFLLFYSNQQLALSRRHTKYYNKREAKTNCWKWINVLKKVHWRIVGRKTDNKIWFLFPPLHDWPLEMWEALCYKDVKSRSTFQTSFSDENESLCWPKRRDVWARGIWCHIWYIFTLKHLYFYVCREPHSVRFIHFEIAPYKISESVWGFWTDSRLKHMYEV